MEFSELIKNINRATERSELATARRYIEENVILLKQKKHLLNHNAREILDFIVSRQQSGYHNLSKKEHAIIRAINLYAERFDIRGIKMVTKEMPDLLMEREALNLLTSDSITLLQSIGLIKKEAYQEQI
ncbi:hypothetical protein [Gracilibacillus xinjiangensis]|uniref:Uncharacterized protein n=1 Tax=Gracilibacillus xinjiangensis TaxID=1193282 RepID=A0ABV8WUC8_9BACI